MNIYSLQYGFGHEVQDLISLNIYLSGCKNNKRCNMIKCQNQLLRNFNEGTNYLQWYSKIYKYMSKEFVECIVLLGGEPLDQNEKDLFFLLSMIDYAQYVKKSNLLIYIYSGYLFEDKKELIIKLFKKGIKAICLGEYNEKENKKKWLYKEEV